MSALSLTDVLAEIPDPRGRQGLRHPLEAILGLVVLGLLMGRRTPASIARLGRNHGPALAHALGFRRGKTPAKSTFSMVLRAVDAEAVEDSLSRWIASRLPEGLTQISLDGKTLRGSRDGELPGQHLLAAYAPEVQAVLAQIRVDATTNEHKAALRLLGILPLQGKVVIGDAIFCQQDLATQVVEQGGDYVLVVKENQPRLGTDIAAGFGFEAAARSIAGAFSPRGATEPFGARGDHGRQGAWPAGAAHPASHDRPDPRATLARAKTSL